MSTLWIIKTGLASVLLPPLNALALLGLAGIFRRRRWAFGVAAIAVVLLGAQSLKPVAQFLLEPLERRAGPVLAANRGAQAIVVLGGGRDRDAPEYGGETVSSETLVRVRYAALLAKRYALPVLVSGGKADGGVMSEAEAMAAVLGKEFGIPVRWREGGSDDTRDNAVMSARMLREAGLRKILLVTHAYHMARARLAFETAGLEVLAAPTGFKAKEPIAPHEWLPQANAMHNTQKALHEWIGLGWYAIVNAGRGLVAGTSVADAAPR